MENMGFTSKFIDLQVNVKKNVRRTSYMSKPVSVRAIHTFLNGNNIVNDQYVIFAV